MRSLLCKNLGPTKSQLVVLIPLLNHDGRAEEMARGVPNMSLCICDPLGEEMHEQEEEDIANPETLGSVTKILQTRFELPTSLRTPQRTIFVSCFDGSALPLAFTWPKTRAPTSLEALRSSRTPAERMLKRPSTGSTDMGTVI
jgi:hypothetical protein